MPFTQTYTITKDYLPSGTLRRSGIPLLPVRFIVAHDTGNPNATAAGNVLYYKNSATQESASAHFFVDDKAIIECIPAVNGTPEKAWHVRYDVTGDNQRYGDDANDVAIGVEYCFGSNINADEAYKRYVWLLAYICFKHNLPPVGSIIGHFVLDPTRRTDPTNGLSKSGRTYEKLLHDVALEYQACTNPTSSTTTPSTAMKLIKNPASNKVYAIGVDNKKHWILNEETFNIGKEMGMWTSEIVTQADDAYAAGHTIVLVKP